METGSGKREGKPLALERGVGGWVPSGRGREGLGGVLEQRQPCRSRQVLLSFREEVLRPGMGGAWLTYHPFSWGAFPSLHHLPGWPWGFIMGVSEPRPPLPHDIMFCPNL